MFIECIYVCIIKQQYVFSDSVSSSLSTYLKYHKSVHSKQSLWPTHPHMTFPPGIKNKQQQPNPLRKVDKKHPPLKLPPRIWCKHKLTTATQSPSRICTRLLYIAHIERCKERKYHIYKNTKWMLANPVVCGGQSNIAWGIKICEKLYSYRVRRGGSAYHITETTLVPQRRQR